MSGIFDRGSQRIIKKTPGYRQKKVGHSVIYAAALMVVQGAYAQSDESSLPSIPDFFEEKAASLGGSVSHSPNEMISTFTGKLSYTVTDLVIPGNGGMDLAIQRSYNSIDDPFATTSTWADFEYSPVGLGWTMHMGRVLRGSNKALCSSSWTVASANPVFEKSDGSRQIFYEQAFDGDLTWMTKDFWRAKCIEGVFIVQSPDGHSFRMTKKGNSFGAVSSKQTAYYPERITDRNGNWFNISYQFLDNGVMAMTKVATSDGRGLDFNYVDSKLSKVVDAGNSREWEYTVTPGAGSRNYLTAVKRPDGHSWNYSYEATPGVGSLSKVGYPSGGTIDYRYGHVDFLAGTPRSRQSTVVVGKTANAGPEESQSGNWNYVYGVATNELPVSRVGNSITHSYSMPPDDRSQVNITQITDPAGKVVEHYHAGYHSVRQAPTSVGIYLGRTSDHENVLLAYQDFIISSQIDVVAQNYTSNSFNPVARVPRIENYNRIGERFTLTNSDFDGYGNARKVVEMATNVADRTYIRETALKHHVDTDKWIINRVASAVVVSEGEQHETKRQFDANGNVVLESIAGVVSSATYHPTGDIATKVNALGQVESFSDYHRGIPRKETYADGSTVGRSVNDAGNVIAETDARGNITRFTHDLLNRVTSVAKPSGAVISVAWTPNTRVVERGDMTEATSFDGFGRTLRREASAPGQVPVWVNYSHNVMGELIHQSYPNSTMGTGYVYDGLSRVVATLNGNPVGTTNAQHINYTSYGNLYVVNQDSTGRASIDYYRAYSDPDKRERVRLASGETVNGSLFALADVRQTRNILGQLTTVSMDGKTRGYGYDIRYFLTSKTDPEIGTTNFERDAIGNLISQRIGAGPATIYAYDSRNRLTDISYPSSEDAAVPNAPAVKNTYDANGNLVVSLSGDISRSFSYDENNKITKESLSVGASTQTLGYAYDSNEALASITYPSGNQVSYEPDAFGRARAVLPYIHSVDYHPNGMPSQISYANGVVSTMGINSRQWPSDLTYGQGSSRFVNSTYVYDPVGNMVNINELADGVYARAFAYDKLDRLITEATTTVNRQYGYDRTGNLTYLRTPTGLNTYTYDTATGLLTGVAGGFSRSFEYDQAGNVSANGYNTFGHDRANNLRCTDCGTAVQKLHDYDGSNMRAQTVAAQGTTQYLHDSQGLLMQTMDSSLRKELIYLGRRQVAERSIELN
ncbi:DUF6531 domain-containing protein [Comamonas sp. JNW]|uniref:DUF6531 domain-containing protein n=1 Tax=Comamonas sp. JNW TaxID=2170731 RepID=UPI0014028E88|nr:DUF6531 domain-containing protein [Comamonas sp. JNW]